MEHNKYFITINVTRTVLWWQKEDIIASFQYLDMLKESAKN